MISSNKFHEAKVKKCHELGGDQEWKYDVGKGRNPTAIYNSAAGMCLALTDKYILTIRCNTPLGQGLIEHVRMRK